MDAFFRGKDWIGAFILRGLYFGSLFPLPPSIISDLTVRGKKEASHPPQVGIYGLGVGTLVLGPVRGLGDNERLAFIWTVQNKMSPEKSWRASPPIPKARASLPPPLQRAITGGSPHSRHSWVEIWRLK